MDAENRILGIKTRKELVGELVRLHRRLTALEPAEQTTGIQLQDDPSVGIEAIVDAVPDIVYQLDEEGKIVFISKAIEAYGFTPDELIGRFVFELIHPDDQEKARYRINERRTGERSTKSLELRLLTKGRKSVPFEFRATEGQETSAATLLFDAEGIYSSDEAEQRVFLYTQGVARDISERKVLEDKQQRLHDELERRVAERTADLQTGDLQLHRGIAERKEAVPSAQESEDRYRRLVELSPDAVFLFCAGRIVFANAVGAQLLGAANPNELHGRPLRDFQAVATPPTAAEAVAEARFIRVDGREIDVEIRTTPFVFQDQPAVLAVVRDITLSKRKKLQQVARQNLHEMVWRMQNPSDSDKILRAIRECLNASGIAFRFCGIHIVGETDGEPKVQHFEYMLADGETVRDIALEPKEAALALQFWHAGIPFYRPDLAREDRYQEREAITGLLGEQVRSVLDLPFSHGMLRVSASQPEAFAQADIAAMQEIATLVQAGFRRIEDLRRLAISSREAVALAEARKQDLAREETMGRIRDKIIAMRTISDLPSEAYWVGELRQLGLSLEGISLQFPAARKGHFVTLFFKDDHYSEEMPLARFPWVKEVWDSGEPVFVQRQRLVELGYEDWEAQFLLEVPMPGGGSLGVRSLAVEVFDQQEIRTLRLFAGLLAEGFQRIQDFKLLSQHEEQLRQAQKMEAIGQLTAGIAHNFNNMLQGIMGNLHLALREVVPPVEDLLKDAERGTRRAADMVQQLMVFARQGVAPEYSAVNAGLLLHDTVDICRQTFNKKFHIVVEIPEDLPPVLGDIGHLQQVFLNLCINAREALEEAGPERPELRLSARVFHLGANEGTLLVDLRPGAYILLKISDNGIGMEAEVRERIFDPFFTTKPVDKGTGLGLSTVYGIIQQHGGAIECQSTPGAGTTFSIYLPVHQASDADNPDTPEQDDRPSGESMAVISGNTAAATLLLIDDERVVRESTARVLEGAGYRVITAATGAQGLRRFREAKVRPMLVLLDLSMPDLSGLEVLEKMRRLDPDVKVMIFTGHDVGAEDLPPVAGVIQKPFQLDELKRLVGQVLE